MTAKEHAAIWKDAAELADKRWRLQHREDVADAVYEVRVLFDAVHEAYAELSKQEDDR